MFSLRCCVCTISSDTAGFIFYKLHQRQTASMELNMDHFYSRCLLCTCRPDVTPHLHVFSQAGKQLQLSDKIYKYLNIQIDAELPQNVCHSCMEKLEVTHELVTSSQQAIIHLLHIKQQEVKQENCSMMELDHPATDSAAIYIENEMENSDSEDFDQPVNILPDHLDEDHITLSASTTVAEGYTEEKMEEFEEVLISEIKIEEHPIKQETKEYQLDCLPQNSDVPLKVARVLVAKLLECDFCCFYTDNKTQLATHMQAHLHTTNTTDGTRKHPANEGCKLKSLQCAQCGIKYGNPEMLAWHTENCHGTEAIARVVVISDKQYRFQCVFCQTECRSLERLIQHLHNQHRISKLPFHCNLCDKQFIRRHYLENHQHTHKKKKTVSAGPSQDSVNSNHSNNVKASKQIGVKCKMCSEMFNSEVFLKDHISKFHAAKSGHHKCLHCKESFRSIAHLTSHCHTRHPGKHVLQCDVCDAGFSSNFKYWKHKRFEHENHVLICNICNAEFTSRSGYTQHKKYKHGETRVFTCDICSANFSHPNSLRSHKATVHCQSTKSFSCKFCSAKFKCKQYLHIHVKHVHMGPILHCNHCKYNTRRKRYLTDHLKVKHSLFENLFACQFCSAEFKCKRYLQNHVRNVHTGKILHYKLGEYNTRTQKDLNLHLREKHSLAKDTFSCKFCSAKFKCKKYLHIHVKQVHTGPILQCDHCRYNTRRKRDLTDHLKVKHSLFENLFACQFCSAEFKCKRYLHSHVRSVHTGKILHCSQCKFNTRRKSNLTLHVRVKHSLVKNIFACQFCSKKFKCKPYLLKHVRSAHIGKILHCDHCKYNTRKRSCLILHLRVKHSLVENTFL